jgi:hypothetical protein
MTPYYPDYPARDGHPYMFALEGNAGTVKKLQAHPDPKADEPRSASRTARNGYRATKQNLHDLVLKTPDPRIRPPTTRCRTTSDGLPALAQRQVTTHPPRGASPPSPAGGMSADLTGSFNEDGYWADVFPSQLRLRVCRCTRVSSRSGVRREGAPR